MAPNDEDLKNQIAVAIAVIKKPLSDPRTREIVRDGVVLGLYSQFCDELKSFGNGWGIQELQNRSLIAEAIGPQHPNLTADFIKHWTPRVERLIPGNAGSN